LQQAPLNVARGGAPRCDFERNRVDWEPRNDARSAPNFRANREKIEVDGVAASQGAGTVREWRAGAGAAMRRVP